MWRNSIKVWKKETVDIKENDTIESIQEKKHKIVEDKEKENSLWNIIVYSSISCIKCRQLKWYLDSKWIEFEERDSQKHIKELERLAMSSLPIIKVEKDGEIEFMWFDRFVDYMQNKWV